MDPNLTAPLLIIASYLLGSISSAIIVCRLMGLPDPRSQGSKNPGATNVMRIGGKKAAAITLLGDSLKGFIPVFAANLLPSLWGLGDDPVGVYDVSAFFSESASVYYPHSFIARSIVGTASSALFRRNLGKADVVTAVSKPL